jgi:hypothetical protein
MRPTLSAGVLTMLILGTISLSGTASPPSDALKLPQTVGAWTTAGPPLTVNATTIFDYMDGAGEMYLAFGFGRLEVTEYKAAGRSDTLTAEVYFMKAQADAFGLLSQDWGGEPVVLAAEPNAPTDTIAPAVRALYGGGLLRLAAGNLYARIQAERETPEAREAVLALGKTVAAGRMFTAEPALLRHLPLTVGPNWKLRRDRLAYFRSHLVLKSLLYLGNQNILDLGPDTEGAVAPYEREAGAAGARRFQLMVVHYPTLDRAKRAREHFVQAYRPEAATELPATVKGEGGWMAYGLKGECFVLAAGCPDRETATKAWGAARIEITLKEANHEKK